jgi:uncharacterized protein YkwD
MRSLRAAGVRRAGPRAWLRALVLLVAATALAGNAWAQLAPTAAGGPSPALADAVLVAVNAYRTAAGLPRLALDPRLTRAAQAHVDDMVTNDFVSHTGSDGGSVVTRGRRAGYPPGSLGENLQAGLGTVEEAVDAWMASPGHRANMLREEFRDLGVGYRFVADDDGQAAYGHYWAIVLGVPHH